jgi:hypothetical protein
LRLAERKLLQRGGGHMADRASDLDRQQK